MQTKNEVLIAEVDVTGRVDFMDGYHHQVLVEYSSQEVPTIIPKASEKVQRRSLSQTEHSAVGLRRSMMR